MALNGMNMAQKTSKQDYMNLLYSDSESDTVPDLKLPPLKGRKQKRKKIHGGRSDDSSCSGWAVLKIIVCFIVLATLVALAGLCFWTVQRIHELQNEVQNLQDSDRSGQELLMIKNQLAQMNSTFKTLTVTMGDYKNMSSQIKSLWNELTQVKETNKGLDNLPSSQILKDMDEKMKIFTDSLKEITELRSDLTNYQNTQKTKHEDIERRLQALEALHSGETQMGPKMDDQLASMLRGEIKSLNNNVTAEVTSVKQEFSQLSGRLSTLEKLASETTGQTLDKDTIRAMVTNLVQQEVENITNNQHLLESSDQEESVSSSNVVEKGVFLAFKEDMMANIQDINATLFILDSEFDQLQKRLNLIETSVINITTSVDKSQQGVHSIPPTTQFMPTLPSKTPVPPTEGTENLVKEERTQLHIDGINTREDLRTAFGNWQLEQNGEVSIENLSGLLGDKAGGIQALKQYDTDGNGTMNEEEIAEALGLPEGQRR